MALFDTKTFNGDVFDTIVRTTPNLRTNELLNSGAIVENQTLAATLPDQLGGNKITTIIKERISGQADNYDGNTDITTSARGNYAMNRIVIGRAHGWTEKDFTSDITGTDYTAAAGEVAEYFADVDQDSLVSSLKGIFAMTGAGKTGFVDPHTYDISGNSTGNTFDATTLNNAMQQACGDKKGNFALAIMHSKIATQLENLKLLEYLKYTDAQGIERKLTLATLNGRMVLVDDTMPVTPVNPVYALTTDTEINTTKTYYTKNGSTYSVVNSPDVAAIATYYELTSDSYLQYTSYALGLGSIEYTNCGVETPSELFREPKVNGGTTTLIGRQRKVFAPVGLSWIGGDSIMSPLQSDLEDGKNWALASSSDTSKKYYPHKSIYIAQIITRG